MPQFRFRLANLLRLREAARDERRVHAGGDAAHAPLEDRAEQPSLPDGTDRQFDVGNL